MTRGWRVRDALQLSSGAPEVAQQILLRDHFACGIFVRVGRLMVFLAAEKRRTSFKNKEYKKTSRN